MEVLDGYLVIPGVTHSGRHPNRTEVDARHATNQPGRRRRGRVRRRAGRLSGGEEPPRAFSFLCVDFLHRGMTRISGEGEQVPRSSGKSNSESSSNSSVHGQSL